MQDFLVLQFAQVELIFRLAVPHDVVRPLLCHFRVDQVSEVVYVLQDSNIVCGGFLPQ